MLPTLALALTLLPGTAEPPPAAVPASKLLRVLPLAPGVYALRPRKGSREIANGGIVIGRKGVVIVDGMTRGATAREIQRLVKALTPLPITHVVLTHHHFDHVGGTKGYPGRVKIVAHENVRKRLRRRNPTGARLPDVTYRHGMPLGEGRNAIALLHPGRGHTTGDTFVHLPRRGILWTGDMAVHRDVGWFGHAHVRDWPVTLSMLGLLHIKTIIPGHGPPGGPKVLWDFIDYLGFLWDSVGKLKREGLSDRRVLRRYRLPPRYATWFAARDRLPGTLRRILAEMKRSGTK